MDQTELLKSLSYAIQPALIFVIIWLVKDRSKDSKKDMEALKENDKQRATDFALMRKDIEIMSRDIATVIVELKNFRQTQEDVVILKRDLITAFKKIDEIKGTVSQ